MGFAASQNIRSGKSDSVGVKLQLAMSEKNLFSLDLI